jgi:5-formyltetrahydrofolate cyclo-ligase
MDIKERKKELRKKIKQIKSLYNLERKQFFSVPIFERLERVKTFKSSNCILMYWSMDDEVFTHDFINSWYKKKTILLPCVDGDNLLLRKYEGEQSMVKGEQFGILEPKGEIFTDFEKIDLMIIPGVAFDSNRNRMGRGRGFYDRLLQTCSCEKIGVCFDFQLINQVPTEEFDIPMDKVISTSATY